MFEALIANHCAPAMAGIKPANIVTCKKNDIHNLHIEVKRLNAELNKRDIYIEILCECKQKALIIVYRRKMLNEHLCNHTNKAFLSQFDYKDFGTADECINILKTRLDCDNFPHEIGVFLGYPLHDIYCFINHRDEGCILVGDWRVYSDPEPASKLFYRFRACKKSVLKKLSEGQTLAQIFCAA